MGISSKELLKVYQSVWAFREQYGEYWTTPTPIESARYAFMEMGEVLDAEMRLKNPHHNRRAVKEINLAEELADVAIMCCSVLPLSGNVPDWRLDGNEARTLDELAFLVAHLLENVRLSSPIDHLSASIGGVLLCISNILINRDGTGLSHVVDQKLEKIYQKRVVPRLD